MHIKTVILVRNFSIGLINFVNLSTTFFIQRFLRFFYFFIKIVFLTFFILVFYIYVLNCMSKPIDQKFHFLNCQDFRKNSFFKVKFCNPGTNCSREMSTSILHWDNHL